MNECRLKDCWLFFIAWFLMGMGVGFVVVGIVGCTSPGTVSTGAVQTRVDAKALDAEGVQTLVNTLSDRIEQVLIGMGVIGSGYGLAELRKWRRDRNGKAKNGGGR